MTLWLAAIFISIAAILFIVIIIRTVYRCITYHGCCKTENNESSQPAKMPPKQASAFFALELVKPERLDSTEPADPDPLDVETMNLKRELKELNDKMFDPSTQFPVDEYDPDGYYPQVSTDGVTGDHSVGYDEPDNKAKEPDTESRPNTNNGGLPPESDVEQKITSHRQSTEYQELDLTDVAPSMGNYAALVTNRVTEVEHGTENPSFEHDKSSNSHH